MVFNIYKPYLKLSSLAFSALILASCSSGPGGANNNNDGPAPKTPEEAVQKLSDSHRNAFENWKTQLVKSCDGSEAFGLQNGNSIDQKGFDVAIFFAKNNHSAIVSDGGGFVILSGLNYMPGVGSSKVEETRSVNGSSYHFQAELQRDGSNCTVLLFGQKVYETHIASSFDVSANWNPASSKPKEILFYSVPTHFPAAGKSSVLEHGFIEAITNSLQPTKDTVKFLASHFGIQNELALQLFRLRSYIPRNAIRLSDNTPGLWFSSESPQLVGATENIKALFDGSKRIVNLEWRLALPQLSLNSIKNDADNGNLKFSASVEISTKPDSPQKFYYSTTDVTLTGITPFDKDETSTCVKDRVRTLKAIGGGIIAPAPMKIQPEVKDALSPCRVLAENMDSQIYSDGTIKTLTPEVLAGVTPNSQIQYNGWDNVVSNLAIDVIEKNGNIRSELDPSGLTKVIQDVADNLTALKLGMQSTSNLGTSHPTIYEMGLYWAFTGQKVSGDRIAQILSAVDNTILSFKTSTEILTLNLARAPNAPSINDNTLSFAQTIGADYKIEANRALGLAIGLGYSEWQGEYFDRILQKRVSLDELKIWSARLQGIQSEISKYPSLMHVTRGSPVRLAIEWTTSGEATIDQVGIIYASLNNAIDTFQDSTDKLILSLADSQAHGLANNKAALDFAGTLTPDYKSLAISIRDTAKATGLDDWGIDFFSTILQKRPQIDQLNIWGVTLKAAMEFTQREQNRMQGDDGFFNERHRKDLIRTSLNEDWGSADFIEVEQISELGKLRTSCDSYRGVSSILSCIGMSQFSRGSKKFLDPAFNQRYGSLASEFAGYIRMMTSDFEFFSLKNSLINGFFSSFNPIWASCSDTAYQAKAAALRTQIPARINEPDQMKKWDLEKAIGNTLKDCDSP